MKRIISILMLIVLFNSNFVYAMEDDINNGDIPIYINNEKIVLSANSKKVDGLYVLPVRAIAEKIGYVVEWNSNNNSVIIKSDESHGKTRGRYVSFVIGSDIVTYGDKTENLKIQYPTYRPVTYLIDGVTYMGCGDLSRALELYFSKNALAQKKEIHLYTHDYINETVVSE